MNKNVRMNREDAVGVVTTIALVPIIPFALILALPSTIINEVVDAFSLEGAGEGLMSSLVSLGFMLSLFVVPVTQGRVQKIPLMIAACALQTVMLFACGASPTFVLFGVSCMILGFSGGFIDACCNSAVVDVRKADSSKYLSYLHGLFGVGSLLAPLMIYWLLRGTDWRGVHNVMAVISAITALIIFLLTLRSGKKGITSDIHEQLLNRADLRSYLRKKRNIGLALASIFASLAQTGVLAWIVRYMTVRFDHAELGALAFSAYWLCSTINRFCFSHIVRRAPMKFFAVGAVIHGIFLIVGILSADPVVLSVMVGALGLVGGHFFPVLVSEFARGYEGKTTFTTTFLLFVSGAGRIGAPLLMAYISTNLSFGIGMMIPIAASFVAAAGGLMAVRSDSLET